MKAMTVSNAFFRRFLAAVAAGTMLSTAFVPVTVAQTAPAAVGLPDFTAIVEKADPAVVNIRTTATVPVRGGNGPGGSDPYEKTMVINAGAVVGAADAAPLAPAAIKVISGSAAGREVALTKVVTTIGKPGVAVAAITRRPHGYVVAMVEGTVKPTINGAPLGTDGKDLRHGDVLELAGTQMQFVQD